MAINRVNIQYNRHLWPRVGTAILLRPPPQHPTSPAPLNARRKKMTRTRLKVLLCKDCSLCYNVEKQLFSGNKSAVESHCLRRRDEHESVNILRKPTADDQILCARFIGTSALASSPDELAQREPEVSPDPRLSSHRLW